MPAIGSNGPELGAQREVNRASDLLARARTDRAAQRTAPALRRGRRLLEPQVGEHRRTVDMTGDLLGAALGGDVLGANQRRTPPFAGQTEQVIGDEWHCPPCAFLPWRIGRRVDDDLTDDPPARVVRVAAGHEKPRQSLGYAQRSGLGTVAVEMS